MQDQPFTLLLFSIIHSHNYKLNPTYTSPPNTDFLTCMDLSQQAAR